MKKISLALALLLVTGIGVPILSAKAQEKNKYEKGLNQNQFRLKKVSKTYWKVTFLNPPINVVDPETIRQLDTLVTQIENDPNVAVVVFDSGDPNYFMPHFDVAGDLSVTATMPNTKRGIHPWPDVLLRLSQVPAVTIASIHGSASGAGSEFLLACDMRFASREKAHISQFEVGVGATPGGGAMARLSRMVGRAKAIEILLTSQDFSGDDLERVGYVNRVLPDAELDTYVDNLANRIGGFDKYTIARTKQLIDPGSLPPASELQPGWNAFLETASRPTTGERVKNLFKEGLYKRGTDVEKRLGEHDGDFRKAKDVQ